MKKGMMIFVAFMLLGLIGKAQSEYPTIIIELGSDNIKAGLASANAPSLIMPTVLGICNIQRSMVGDTLKDFYYGNDALANKNILQSFKYRLMQKLLLENKIFFAN